MNTLRTNRSLRRTRILAVMLAHAAVMACACSAAAAEKNCERGLMVRNQLSKPGIVPGPARLALQHTAGESTFGLADIAIFSGKACAEQKSDSYFDYGVEYHLNQNDAARTEKISAAISYSRTYYDLPEEAGGEAGSRKSVQYFLRYGRDVERDTRITHAGVNFSMFEFAGNDGRGGKKQGKGPLGGQFKRQDNSTAFEYEIIPGIEYFAGYQPAGIDDRLDAGYADATARWQWSPFAKNRQHLQGVYVSAEWTGRRRLWGDDPLPHTANLTTASVGYTFIEAPTGNRKSSVSLALDYQKGRDPDNGFAMDETFFLALKYKLDRND